MARHKLINSDFNSILNGETNDKWTDNVVIKKNGNLIKKVIIRDIDFIGLVIIKDSKINYEIEIFNCVFYDNFQIHNSITSSKISFILVEMKGGIEINNSQLDTIIFNRSFNLKENFYIHNRSCVRFFQLKNGKCENIMIDQSNIDELELSMLSFDKLRIFSHFTLINSLKLEKLTFNFLDIFSLAVVNYLEMSGFMNIRNRIVIDQVFLNRLKFHFFENVNSAKISFSNIAIIDSIKQVNDKKVSELLGEKQNVFIDFLEKRICDLDEEERIKLFSNTDYNFQDFYQFYYKSDDRESELEIDNSELNKVKFKNFDFGKFKKIKINDSDLAKTEFFNSFISKKNVLGNYNSLYETFNDLANTALRKNNTRDKIEYYKFSQFFLFKNLLSRKQYYNFPSIVSLSISKYFSNFGTNWLQAFLSIIVFGSFFFSIMVLSTKYNLDFKLTISGWKNFKDLSAYFIQYLNPTHRINFMDSIIPHASKSTWFVLFDFLGRIFISIGIFDLIRSFRKYVRK